MEIKENLASQQPKLAPRQIKFRAFFKDYGNPDELNGSMFYQVFPASPDFKTWLISFTNDNSYDGDFVVGEDIEVMQFTGLLDKNEKEIFEGDYIKITDVAYSSRRLGATIEIVEWNHDYAGFCGIGGGLIESVEILGNIFENPELGAASLNGDSR